MIGFSWPVSAEPNYKPARVASAGDAYIPFQIMIDGFFVFDVLLNDDGTVERSDARRRQNIFKRLEISVGVQEPTAGTFAHDRKLSLPPSELR